MSNAYFISGIDTDAGKTYVTGYIARRLMEEGKESSHRSLSRPAIPTCRRT